MKPGKPGFFFGIVFRLGVETDVMRYLIVLSHLLISSLLLSSVQFQEIAVKQAIDSALANKKMVMVVFTSSNCPACSYMENNVFSNLSISDVINASFVSVRSTRATTEGKREQYRYKISILPTTLIIDPEKGEVMRMAGKKDPARFVALINKALKGDYSGGDPIGEFPEASSGNRTPVNVGRTLKWVRKEECRFESTRS